MSYLNKIGKEEIKVDRQGNQWTVNNSAFDLSSDDTKNVIDITDKKGTTHQAVIRSIQYDKKTVTVLLDQKEIVVEISDDIDQKMLALGIDLKKLQKVKSIKAPMPGLILKTLVSEGQEIKAGQPLFVLEAMKMENVFNAPDDVIVKTIKIKEGDTVDKNQELIVFA
jgi:biotin carboxyl carrier protein